MEMEGWRAEWDERKGRSGRQEGVDNGSGTDDRGRQSVGKKGGHERNRRAESRDWCGFIRNGQVRKTKQKIEDRTM